MPTSDLESGKAGPSYYEVANKEITRIVNGVKGAVRAGALGDIKPQLEELKHLAAELHEKMSKEWEEINDLPFDQVSTDVMLRVYKGRELVHYTRHFVQGMEMDLESRQK